MVKVLDNLEISEIDGNKVFRCLKCGCVLGPFTNDYKNYTLKCDAPISEAQPRFLAPSSHSYVLREYYCPKCGVMFEVDMVRAEEKQIWSIRLEERKF